MTHPERKRLPHEVPSWVQAGAVYFITLCGRPKGRDQFSRPSSSAAILDSAKFQHERFVWHMHLLVLMPDHIHGLLAFAPDRPIKQVMSSWKGYLAKTCGIEWQRDYFEHRIRDDAEFVAKAHYIRANPVRAGLVNRPEEWPHTWPRQDESGAARTPLPYRCR